MLDVIVGELEDPLPAVGEGFVQCLLLFLESDEHGRHDPRCVADSDRPGSDDGEGGLEDGSALGDLDLHPVLVASESPLN